MVSTGPELRLGRAVSRAAGGSYTCTAINTHGTRETQAECAGRLLVKIIIFLSGHGDSPLRSRV